MNKLLFPLLTSIVLFSGCKNPFEAKDKGVDQLNNIESRWEDTYTLASSTSRIALATPVSNLQDIKRDLAQAELSECLNPAKKALGSYMDSHIKDFLKFMSDPDYTQFQSNNKLVEYFKIKEQCAGKEKNPDSKLAAEAKIMEAMLKLEQEKEARFEKEAKAKGVSIEVVKAAAAKAEADAALAEVERDIEKLGKELDKANKN